MRRTATPSRLLLLAALLAVQLRPSQQHGYLLFPESRNYQASVIPPDSDPNKSWCPSCGQGGGVGKIPSMCGDPFQNVVGDAAFVPFTNRFYRATPLTQGQTLTVRIGMSTNHGGRMSLSICPLARGQVKQDCFNQPQYQLRRVNADAKYNNKRFWYLSSANGASAEEAFRLPAGISCDGGCMIQWWWVGYQNCFLPCEDTSVDDVPGECGMNLVNPGGVSKCGSVLQTEQFYNCGDIIISSSGSSSGGQVPTSTPSATASSPPPSRSSSSSSLSPPAQVTPASSSSSSSAGSSDLCPAASGNPDVVRGCQTCVSQGLPSWACVQQCAQAASSSAQMAGCTACLGAPGVNSWGCQNCLQAASGDTAKSAQCFTCVMAGKDPWACGQCLTRANYGACFTCLSTAGSNTYPCYS